MSYATSTRANPQQHQRVAPQSTGDTVHNVPNAALRGASKAFLKPPVAPKPLSNTYTGGGNGALLAATKVGTGSPRSLTPSGATSPLRKDWTGGSTLSAGRSNASPLHQLSNSSSSSTLGIPEDTSAERIPSPSNIAAKLAAARHVTLKPTVQATVRPIMSEREQNEGDVMPPPGSVGNVLARLDSSKSTPSDSQRKRRTAAPGSVKTGSPASWNDAQSTDDTPIAPTTSLVKMFEHTQPAGTSRTISPAPLISKSPPPVRSPKPQRKIKLPPEPTEDVPLQRQRTKTPPPIKPKPKPQLHTYSLPNSAKEESVSSFSRRSSTNTPMSTQTATPHEATVNNNSRPKPPLKKMSRQARPKSEDMARAPVYRNRTLSSSMSNQEPPSSPTSFVSAREEQEEEKAKPAVPPPRRSTRQKPEGAAEETNSKTATPLPLKYPRNTTLSSPVPAPQLLPRPQSASVSRPSTPTRDSIYHSNYQRESVKAISKHMTGESLSNAIVGAALASSRNVSPSPAKMATPDFARKQHHHLHSPFHRSPSPPKPQPTGKLRSTMRKEPSSSSDEETDKYKRKGTRIMGMGRKHPNKHHEGTRKRWRDQITERERKRYEGVWAANKGIFVQHIPSHSPSRALDDDPLLDVSNLVVKELWMRSRLPEHELEEVWDLVDARGIGRLRKEEFVVGMWLIDQRLKGRKLPARVSESVWGSVRGAGVKIRVKPR
ncbi:hypothetical protein DM02DRAFT_610812 [Periconia macrospinosa]|uniref:EH domain-containing protein n=1 Tax=Periconia macrospinosa TaxID=97972 RepID=A0A2V1E3T6_9PLEO|nr:hypothetical protein DM02DRAFT_610812 [Periconia macrospinosa]